MESLGAYPTSIWLVLARFICGIVLHMSLQDELFGGLNNMKFALNHHYRFTNYRFAYLSGILQASMIITVEIVNFFAIMKSTTIADVVMNFMALAVVSEFDDAFYSALGDDPMKDMITEAAFDDLFTVKTTTSSEANFEHDDHRLDDDTCLSE